MIEVNVERRGGATAKGIFAEHVHFGDIPCLATGHDEIVSSLGGQASKHRFELLGGDVNRGDYCRVVVLVVEDYRW